MCGIIGYAGEPDGSILDSLLAARDRLAHRGPDGSGMWRSRDGRVVLGHRRLAILDLSSAGSQPMVSGDDALALVFNGEIYNHGALRAELRSLGHSFRGHSDTEVILAAFREWDVACLSRLRGMFAFGLFDNRAGRLVLARDRAGEKPLYWSRYRGGMVFASELKALLALPAFDRYVSPDGLDAFLAYGYVPGDLCLVAGVSKVRPGHYLELAIDGQATRGRRYWNLPAPLPGPPATEEDLADELDNLLQDSVREQLQADVPVAVLLSGGTDSSLVTAFAASASPSPVQTFSVGFPDSPAFDERQHAARISAHFGTRHTELTLEASAIDVLPTLSRHYDEPIADSSTIPTYLLCQLVSRHVKVVLGGDAGDELFGGYRAYQGALELELWRRRIPSPLRALAAQAAMALLPAGYPRRNALLGLAGGLANGVARMGTMFDLRQRQRIAPVLRTNARVDSPLVERRSQVEPDRGVPGAYMAADFRAYLPEDLLVKVDRASMAHSLEVRTPFLDARIIEFAFSKVANSQRASPAERKILLQRLARRRLPASFDASRKQGFSVPLSGWMTPEYRLGALHQFRSRLQGCFDFGAVSPVLLSRDPGGIERAFGLLLLMNWMQYHGMTLR